MNKETTQLRRLRPWPPLRVGEMPKNTKARRIRELRNKIFASAKRWQAWMQKFRDGETVAKDSDVPFHEPKKAFGQMVMFNNLHSVTKTPHCIPHNLTHEERARERLGELKRAAKNRVSALDPEFGNQWCDFEFPALNRVPNRIKSRLLRVWVVNRRYHVRSVAFSLFAKYLTTHLTIPPGQERLYSSVLNPFLLIYRALMFFSVFTVLELTRTLPLPISADVSPHFRHGLLSIRSRCITTSTKFTHCDMIFI